MASKQSYSDGMSITCDGDRKNKVNTRYLKYQCTVRFKDLRQDFLNNVSVPVGFTVKFNDRLYREGERLFPGLPEGCFKRPAGQVLAALTPPAEDCPPPAEPYAPPAPTLDMFDDTDPNAPRTHEQNSTFWGLLDRLSALTGKTPNEMKAVLVTRALGENRGTSKLTVAEMDRVIGYVSSAIALFEKHLEEGAQA